MLVVEILSHSFVKYVGVIKSNTKHTLQSKLKRSISGYLFCSNICSSNFKKLTLEVIQERSNILFQNKYKIIGPYINSTTPLTIDCSTHGSFKQTANNHLNGYGCYLCGKDSMRSSQVKSEEQWIIDRENIHNNKYYYPEKYVTAHTKISIGCYLHSLFLMSPNSHLNGQGCPECSLQHKGWSDTSWCDLGKESAYFDSFKVYILYCFNNVEQFVKIGKTFRKTKIRFKSKNEMPYDYVVISELIFEEGLSCCNFERQLHNKYHQYKYSPSTPFGGDTECFNKKILELIENKDE